MATSKRKRTPEERRRDVLLSVRDLVFAGVAVLLIIGAIWAYSGVWPPMVVVESGSMMHEPNTSAIGVIDTGDLTLVKSVGSEDQIITYMQGKDRDYRTYGNYGDVIIYAKNCDRSQTPIIHRAITRMVLNESGFSFDFPEIGRWGVVSGVVSFDVWTYHVNGPEGQSWQINIDVDAIKSNMTNYGAPLHGGILTKGDNNAGVDQMSLNFASGHANLVQPVQLDCILGVARGELPWFGVIKLWFGKGGSKPPENSVTNLFIALIAIIAIPFVLELAWDRYGDRVKSRFPERWRRGWHRVWDKLPGGKLRAQEREEIERERAAERARRERRERGRRRRRDGSP